MVIYADVIFSVNFISTFSLLSVYAVLAGSEKKYKRIACASLISGLYAVAESVYAFSYILRVFILVLVVATAFGRSSLIYNTARFGLMSVCVQVIFIVIMSISGKDGYISSGSITVFSSDIWGAAVYVFSYPILIFITRLWQKRKQIRISDLVINGKKIKLLLLYDSGNLLMHNGVTVAVVAWDSIKSVMECNSYEELLLSGCDTMVFNTVGRGGMMPVIETDHAIIDGIEKTIRIAIINRSFNLCDGIIGI